MRDVVITEVQCSGPAGRSRNLEERLMVRFPTLYQRWSALFLRLLSPGSRLRRAILHRALISGWAAFNRRDFKLMLVRYAPDVEFEFDPGQQELDLGGIFRGHEGILDGLGQLAEGLDMRFEPAYILDLGDRALGLGFYRAHARASGVQLGGEIAQLVTPRNGLVARDQSWYGWEEGLRAAGLDPDVIALPKRGKAEQEAGSSSYG
jgi:ketosteroid isomerase-like protein